MKKVQTWWFLQCLFLKAIKDYIHLKIKAVFCQKAIIKLDEMLSNSKPCILSWSSCKELTSHVLRAYKPTKRQQLAWEEQTSLSLTDNFRQLLASQLTIFLFLSAICSSDSISTSLLIGVFSSISSIKSGSWKMEMSVLQILYYSFKLGKSYTELRILRSLHRK